MFTVPDQKGQLFSYWLTEAERAQWVLGVQSGETRLADFSSGLGRTVSCLDDGSQHPASHPGLHPHFHGVPDHSVQHYSLNLQLVVINVRLYCPQLGRVGSNLRLEGCDLGAGHDVT